MASASILFILSVAELSFGHVLFQNVIENGLVDLRTKREASCGGELQVNVGKSEVIQLRTEIINGTEYYRVNEKCTWKVTTGYDNYLLLSSEYFSLEESENCEWDYVQIEELGLEAELSPMSSRYCGWDPVTYITISNEITITFESDVSYEDLGFKFTVTAIDWTNVPPSKCNTSIPGGIGSHIMNAEDAGASCFYRIQAPEGKVIELTLLMLDFGSLPCHQESLVIYEGLSTREPLGEICSDAVAETLPYHAQKMFIVYRNPWGQEGDRFDLQYDFVEDNFTPAPTPSTTPSPVGGNNDCSGIIKDIISEDGTMIYTAPEYENDKHCILVVRNTMLINHVVQIEFLRFEIEDSDNCTFDSLRVLSGERSDSEELGGPYCDESLDGRTLLTRGNSLRLEFKTDNSFALLGFKARISFVPVGQCECTGNRICVLQDYERKCLQGKECEANVCLNGGTCIVTGSDQTCYCPAGVAGDDCSEVLAQIYHLEFIEAPTSRSLKRGESHVEQCAVKVPPGEEVQYSWTFKGVLIEPYSSSVGFGSYPGGVLQIDSFTDQLEGQYSCFATTSVGTAEHTFEYRLVEDCDIRIYPGPQSENKKIGENALLICHVDSRAKEVRWKKNGLLIDYNSNPRFEKLVNNYLYIRDIGMEDAGTYQCEAEDMNGCYSYKEGELTVLDVKPLNEYCGISIHDENKLIQSRISKGYDAKPNGNPWAVTFRSTIPGNVKAFCGGTVISQRYILTAAHCIEEFEDNFDAPWSPANVEFLLGTTDCLGTDQTSTRRTFKSYKVHDDFHKLSQYDSDIALIELDSPVEYTNAIRPICLEPKDYNDRTFLELSNALSVVPGKVAGCGVTIQKRKNSKYAKSMQEIHLPYVRKEACEESLEKTKHKLTDAMFCAGSNIRRSGDTCGGDSGSGLVMATSNRWVQTGIVSWSVGGCDVDKFYGVYTNVGMFYDWIKSISKFDEEVVPDFLGI